MATNRDRPLRYGFRSNPDRNPGYVAVDFFIGHNEGARPNCGSILVDPGEWAEVRLALVAGGFDEVPSIGHCRRCRRNDVEVLGDICGTCADDLLDEERQRVAAMLPKPPELR